MRCPKPCSAIFLNPEIDLIFLTPYIGNSNSKFRDIGKGLDFAKIFAE